MWLKSDEHKPSVRQAKLELQIKGLIGLHRTVLRSSSGYLSMPGIEGNGAMGSLRLGFSISATTVRIKFTGLRDASSCN